MGLLDERDVADGAAAGSAAGRAAPEAASPAQRLDGAAAARARGEAAAKQLAAGDGGAAVAQLRPEARCRRQRAARTRRRRRRRRKGVVVVGGGVSARRVAVRGDLRSSAAGSSRRGSSDTAPPPAAVLSVHAATAGASAAGARAVSDELRAQWLEDGAIRLLCVLALDRFGDWAAGDRVAAPVREAAAQALAALLGPMGAAAAARVADALLTMQATRVWEVRHGALRPAALARADLLPALLPRAAPPLLDALLDDDDDVRAASAECFAAVAAHGAAPLLGDALLPRLLGLLWDALRDVDELSAAAVPVLDLLAALAAALPYASFAAFAAGGGRFEAVVPRLWRFVHHPGAAVRAAAAGALGALLAAAAGAGDGRIAWLDALLPSALALLLHAAVVEETSELQQAALGAWAQALAASPAAALAAAAETHLNVWLAFAATPLGVPLDTAPILRVVGGGSGALRVGEVGDATEGGASVRRRRRCARARVSASGRRTLAAGARGGDRRRGAGGAADGGVGCGRVGAVRGRRGSRRRRRRGRGGGL